MEDNIFIFLSYSHKDRLLASEIKQNLENNSLSVFLAHEDISPTIEWQEEIFKQLKKCDLFIPLFSKNFVESKWTDQETGIAYGFEKIIIPVSLDDTAPYGFIGKYQTLKYKEDIIKTCEKILHTIMNKPIGGILKDVFIKNYFCSESYIDAKENAQILQKYIPYNENQINAIMSGLLVNNQIYESFKGRRIVSDIIDQHSEVISPDLYNFYITLKQSDWDGDIFNSVYGMSVKELIFNLIIKNRPNLSADILNRLIEEEQPKLNNNYYAAMYIVMKNLSVF